MNDDIQNKNVGSIDGIYKNVIPELVRSLISEHFVPTNEEMTTNAEISTPVLLHLCLDSRWKLYDLRKSTSILQQFLVSFVSSLNL
jgi:hypothetical protein